LIVTCDGIIDVLPHEVPEDDGAYARMLTVERRYDEDDL
jgi:hypothetical protein